MALAEIDVVLLPPLGGEQRRTADRRSAHARSGFPLHGFRSAAAQMERLGKVPDRRALSLWRLLPSGTAGKRIDHTSGSLQDIGEFRGKPFLLNGLQVVSRMT